MLRLPTYVQEPSTSPSVRLSGGTGTCNQLLTVTTSSWPRVPMHSTRKMNCVSSMRMVVLCFLLVMQQTSLLSSVLLATTTGQHPTTAGVATRSRQSSVGGHGNLRFGMVRTIILFSRDLSPATTQTVFTVPMLAITLPTLLLSTTLVPTGEATTTMLPGSHVRVVRFLE